MTNHVEPKYECSKCLKKFRWKKHHTCHLNVCPATQSDLSSHSCSDCGKNLSSAARLAWHVLMHHEPVACDMCGITLSSLFLAQNHQVKMHTETQHKCPHCSTQVSGRMHFQRHVSYCESKNTPCEFCGKTFKHLGTAEEHMRLYCRDPKKIRNERINASNERGQKNVQTSQSIGNSSLPQETISEKNDTGGSCTEKTSTPFVENGLSKTLCYYCNEECSSTENLDHHLKIYHELSKCDICRITVLGPSEENNHKLKCLSGPNRKCQTCGGPFLPKGNYDLHCFSCERRTCKLCWRVFKHSSSFELHKSREHPDASDKSNVKIEQEQPPAQNDDLKLEITVEETMISAHDEQGQPTLNPSMEIDGTDLEKNANDDGIGCSGKTLIHDTVEQMCTEPPVENPSIQFKSNNQGNDYKLIPAQNDDLKLEIIVEETMISAHNHQGQPTLNPSMEIDGADLEKNANDDDIGYSGKSLTHDTVSDIRSSEHSTTYLNDDNDIVSQVIEQVSVATLSSNSENQVVEEQICTEPPVENPSIQFKSNNQGNAYKLIPAQNDDLKLEIIVEESMISAHYDQGHPKLNPSLEIDGADLEKNANDDDIGCSGKSLTHDTVSDIRLSDHLSTYINDDNDIASQVIEDVSVATLSSSSENQVVVDQICTESPVENPPIQLKTNNQGNTYKMIAAKHQCPHCAKKYYRKKLCEAHASACLRGIKPCELCGQKFINVYSARNHMKRVHLVNGPVKLRGMDCTKELKKTSIKKPDSEKSSAICSGKDSALQSNGLNPADHLYTCRLCGLSFTGYYQAEYHTLTKHTEARYQCPHCLKKFHQPAPCKKHTLRCAERKITCKLCNRKLKSVNSFKKHMTQIHRRRFGTEGTVQQKQNSDKHIDSDKSSTGGRGENSALELHGVGSSSGLFNTKCPHCEKDLSNGDSLSGHIEQCYCVLLPHRYSCPTLLYSIRQHKRLDHPEDFTLEETTISLQGHPGQSTVNVSTNVHGTASMETANVQKEVLSSRQSLTEDGNLNPFKKIKFFEDSGPSESNEFSGNGNDYTDAEKESSMHSSVDQFKCSICDEKFFEFSDIRQHMLSNHTDGLLRCQFCSKKIRRVQELEPHQIVCAKRKFSCKLCTHKFKLGSSIKKHMNKFHPNSLPLESEEQQSNSFKEIDATGSSNKQCPYCEKTFSNLRLRARHIFVSHEPTACDMCGLTFANATRARYHKDNCAHQQSTKPVDYHTVKEVYPYSMGVPQEDNEPELKMEIQVEDTVIQDLKHQVPNEDQEKSSTIISINHPSLSNEIIIKEEFPEKEEDSLTVSQRRTEPLEFQEMSRDCSDPPERPEADDEFSPCYSCGLSFSNRHKLKYHMVIAHTEPQHKCPHCPKMFHFSHRLQRHAMSHGNVARKNSRR